MALLHLIFHQWTAFSVAQQFEGTSDSNDFCFTAECAPYTPESAVSEPICLHKRRRLQPAGVIRPARIALNRKRIKANQRVSEHRKLAAQRDSDISRIDNDFSS
jgi:hypothetical protein